jgi:hypothetical protein
MNSAPIACEGSLRGGGVLADGGEALRGRSE